MISIEEDTKISYVNYKKKNFLSNELPMLVLKEYRQELSAPLQKSFNNSLRPGIVPKSWKTAHVQYSQVKKKKREKSQVSKSSTK